MQTEPFAIKPYREIYREQMISVWESSARATHHFLTPDDLEYYKNIVACIDYNSFPVFCLLQEDRVVGFIGVADKKVEMLFLSPDYRGQGLGKRPMNFAMTELNVDKVDVNEQNGSAVEFYKKMGFVTYQRTEKDSGGKDYPVLKMKRSGA